jgi:exopolysaccharide biosynthesis polyprenyl glycosylphosphotransferase
MHSSVGVKPSREQIRTLGETDALSLVGLAQPHAAASKFRRIVLMGEALADLFTITLTVSGSYALYYYSAIGKHIRYSPRAILGLALVFGALMVIMLDRAGAYRRGNSLLRVRETEQILRVSTQAFLIALAVSFLSSYLFSRWFLVLCLGLVPLSLFLQKSILYLFVSALHSEGYGTERVLIYGSGCTGRRVFSALARSPKLGLDPVAFVDDDPAKSGGVVFEMGYERRRSSPVIQGPISKELLAEYQIDSVIIAIPSVGRDRFLQAVEQAFSANVNVSFVPSHFLISDPLVNYQDIDGIFLASFDKSAPKSGYELFKRFVDIGLSAGMLVLGSPLLLSIGLMVRMDSSGPVLFRQKRVGKDGTQFSMYKFRTMYTEAPPYEFSPTKSIDPRITRLGRFLRRTSLDELPQLLNVIEGSMSLVGPRPEMPFIVAQYNDRHNRRLQVKPGITGLWQLSGDRAFLIHENIDYDLYYVQHRNFFMDFAILLHTIIFAMRGV